MACPSLSPKQSVSPSAFTLIELLIVVAIIAILAAIALPNFLEAQTRSKVSRVMADERSIALALDMYYIDNNTFPLTDLGDFVAPTDLYYHKLRAWVAISSPVAYITTGKLIDPFRPSELRGDPAGFIQIGTGHSTVVGQSGFSLAFPRDVYALVSAGPDYLDDTAISAYPFTYGLAYDSTNGTRSRGDVFRCGPTGKVPRGWKTGPPTPEQLGEFVPNPF